MPKLTVENVGEFEVAEGKRLVLALTDDAGIDQLHACGGLARCTTCKVEFQSGEPDQMTEAEKNTLAAKGLTQPHLRLSCQIACDHDMTVLRQQPLCRQWRKTPAGARRTRSSRRRCGCRQVENSKM